MPVEDVVQGETAKQVAPLDKAYIVRSVVGDDRAVAVSCETFEEWFERSDHCVRLAMSFVKYGPPMKVAMRPAGIW